MTCADLDMTTSTWNLSFGSLSHSVGEGGDINCSSGDVDIILVSLVSLLASWSLAVVDRCVVGIVCSIDACDHSTIGV